MSPTTALANLIAFEAPALPTLNALASSKERILNRWPEVVATPPEKDREHLVQEVRRRLESNLWNDTPMSLVTSAARALLDKERRARPDLQQLREFYYAEVRASTRQSFLELDAGGLCRYLRARRAAHPRTRICARRCPRASGGKGRHVLRHVPELLDPVRAPDAIAARMVAMEDCWTGLKAIGLGAPHAPGVMDHAHLAFVGMVAPGLKSRAGLDKIFAWLKPEGQSARISGAAEAITAVLEPWLERDPPKAELTFITETLLGLYGDPRVDSGGPWAGVFATHLAVLMRWLTGENIRFFLDVVSAVEESHMWEPRRKFWLSLHDQKRIDAAWVAFSRSAARHARRHLSSRGSRSLLSFGNQTAGGSRIDTSLLILKIGNKIVVEGSHSYKVHIFKQSNRNAPQLYRREYDCESIRTITGSEAKSHNGNWQSWVLERI